MKTNNFLTKFNENVCRIFFSFDVLEGDSYTLCDAVEAKEIIPKLEAENRWLDDGYYKNLQYNEPEKYKALVDNGLYKHYENGS